MTPWQLLFRNLSHYRWKNLAVILGISISAAVLTGAFIVGDSVTQNLNRIVDLRLGDVNYSITTGERFVTSDLAISLQDELGATVSPVLLLEGIAVAGGGESRVNNIQVLGVDPSFDKLMGIDSFYATLSVDESIISNNLAERLNLKAGDEFLLRIKKASLIPLNAPFVTDEDLVVSARLKIKAIAGDNQAGRFNLRISQTSPYNVFLSSELLNRLMELENKSNLLLLSSNSSLTESSIYSAIQKRWSFQDAGLIFRNLSATSEFEILSERVFLDDPVLNVIKTIPLPSELILTYFVNSVSTLPSPNSSDSLSSALSTPYSFVSTLSDSLVSGNEIIVNEWLADDLGIKPGDSIIIKYFIVGPLRRLTESEEKFMVKEIVPIEGRYADLNLMPEIPGLSDAGNCRDWETGIPIDLEKIRDKDEKYWTDHKGTPKAFISNSLAKELWENMYGSYTAIRFPSGIIPREELINHISSEINPVSLGFQVSAVKDDSHKAAGQGVDFSQLFLGLSFFVLLSAFILTALLLILNLEGRRRQIETISAMGIPRSVINRLMYAEGLILSVLGSLAGMALAVLYTNLVFSALNGVWSDIVRTDMMEMVVRIPVLLSGFFISVLISWATLFLTIRNFLKPKKKKVKTVLKLPAFKTKMYLASVFGLSSVVLISIQILSSEIINTAIFFLAGGLMLISLLFWFYYFMDTNESRQIKDMNIINLSIKNSLRNKNRSLSIVSLLGIGTFIVLSTGANRKDLFVNASDKTSGTGGFLFFTESTVPVHRDLNNPAVRKEFGLTEDSRFVLLSHAPGDDASCLNLNRISNPRILGVNPEELEGRFSFVSRTPYLSSEFPWSSLDNPLPGGVIPAIADQTVIKWGLGKKTGDTLVYTDGSGNSLNLLLIGGLANSVFQGNVIISNENFQKHFPDHIGSGVLLIDGKAEKKSELADELNLIFRDYGWDTTTASERLAAFNSVENTYLSVFLLMGALAILIGTIGLSIILARSILERKAEIALIKAVGIGSKKVLRLIMNEYIFLLITGILIGILTSALATLPSLISPDTGISINSVLVISGILLLNGFFWIWIMARVYLQDKAIGVALKNE